MNENQFDDWKKRNNRVWGLVNSKEFRKSLPKQNELVRNAEKMLGRTSGASEHLMGNVNNVAKGFLAATHNAPKDIGRLRGIKAIPDFGQSEYWKKLHEMAERARKSVENFRSKYPKQKEVIDKIYNSGWAIGNEIGNFSNLLSSPEKFAALSKEDIDGQYADFYITNQGIFDELKSVQSSLTLHHEVIAELINTLHESPSSWKLLYPQIFAIIDAILVSQRHDGSLEVDDYSNFKRVKKMRQVSKKDEKFEIDIFKYIRFKTLKKAEKLWDWQSFELPSKNVKFGRNSIQQGRYDPHNFEYKQFVQLVVLMTTLCIYSKNYGKIERN